MPKTRKVFICGLCGNESLKWLGKCPQCGEWNSFIEKSTGDTGGDIAPPQAQELDAVPLDVSPRLSLHSSEFNCVLGGGVVPGSLVLIGGDPGIGKSTLLLQMAGALAETGGKVLYVSGEESVSQIKIRARRVGIKGKGLFILPETRMENVVNCAGELSPHLVIVDSIQTVHTEGAGAAGSVAQVRECTLHLMQWAKSSGIPVLLVGHVTKEGTIAGPHILEHMVDVVLYLEGERFSSYRLLRSVKNRYGSTDEIGIFEMRDKGLVEVANPSQVLLSHRTEGAIGAVVVPTLEGTRPLLVEVQALTNPTNFGIPRRTSSGFDFNRLLLIAAVLSRRGGIPLSNQDIIANVAGGIKVNEPAIDLGLALAIASSVKGVKMAHTMAAVGEVGLSGELRAVSQAEKRIAEATKLGMQAILLPPLSSLSAPSGIELKPVRTLQEALKIGLEPKT